MFDAKRERFEEAVEQLAQELLANQDPGRAHRPENIEEARKIARVQLG